MLAEWKVDPLDDRLNPNGSGISLGHPIGATGARILATAAYEARRRSARTVLETMCIGGGQGLAAVFEVCALARRAEGSDGAVDVHAVVSGRADAPLVVLSNSLGSTHRMWDAQLADLEQRFRVVRYDTRGHGDSPVPDGPYSINDLADDLVALLDRLGVQRARLVGLSLGGMTVMRVASRNPERVERIALLCTGAQLPPAEAWLERAATVRAQGSQAVATAVVERWFTPAYLDAHPDARSAHERMVASTPAEGYAGCCEAIAKLDLREELSAISVPTLAIAGDDDPAAPPAKLEEIATRIPGARLLTVPRAAHLANAEQPGIITPALIEHLEQQ